MKKTITFLISGILIFIMNTAIAQSKNYLQECWKKQAKPVQSTYLSLAYTEKLNELEHSFEPWQQTHYIGKGTIWSNAESFLKSDTITTGKRLYNSKTHYNDSTLLFVDYGDEDFFPVTQGMFSDYVFKTARYSPATLIHYFYQKKVMPEKEDNSPFASYKITINKTLVTLFIRKADQLLAKVTTLGNDELFGDVVTALTYAEYATINKLYYPKLIVVEKINGKIKDEVTITGAQIMNDAPMLLNKPSGYVLKEEKVTEPVIKVEKHNENIHFVELRHTGTRVLVVEFNEFLFVSEAPLNSANGDLIIKEAKKIAPGKPIKYFSFSHYHPHPIGGIRAFIHQGAKIICSDVNEEYVNYLAKAPHTLLPDSLQIESKILLTEKIKDSLIITDGKYELKIYVIGKKSEHTNDFLVYYFPAEKLLFESDLIWIPKEGEIRKAGGRQAGLYHAIKDLGLNVNTIIQSWPIEGYGLKTIIPFGDLEKSVNLK